MFFFVFVLFIVLGSFKELLKAYLANFTLYLNLCVELFLPIYVMAATDW